MATPIKPGDIGPNVEMIQRWLWQLYKANPSKYLKPGPVTGEFDESTRQAMRRMQRKHGIPVTGQWDDATRAFTKQAARFVSGGKNTDVFTAAGPDLRSQTLAADREYIIGLYRQNLDRDPTFAELDAEVQHLQQGMPRTTMAARLEKMDPQGAVNRMYLEVLGREPTPEELTKYSGQIARGVMTRLTLRSTLAGSPEGLLKAKETEATDDQEDARTYMDGLLDTLGLGSLKDWAWEQIQKGHSIERIQQELRQTDEHKARFPGMALRQEQGLAQMTEGEYLEWELQAKQLARQYGLPPGFYDQPDDFAALIGGNVSIPELAERIQDGYVRVNQAPAEVRARFAEWYGPMGDSALAAFFLDKDKATPLLQRMVAAAEIGGTADQFGYDFTMARAEQIAAIGLDGQSARSGLAQIKDIDPLFVESVSEVLDLTAEEQGADAVFDLGGDGGNQLRRRQAERQASLSGGGGAALGRTGTGVGTAE